MKIVLFSSTKGKYESLKLFHHISSYLRHSLKLIAYYFEINDYPQIYRECSVEDQKLLAIFTVDTGRYARQQYVYSKRTAAAKLKVQLPLVEINTVAINSKDYHSISFCLKSDTTNCKL